MKKGNCSNVKAWDIANEKLVSLIGLEEREGEVFSVTTCPDRRTLYVGEFEMRTTYSGREIVEGSREEVYLELMKEYLAWLKSQALYRNEEEENLRRMANIYAVQNTNVVWYIREDKKREVADGV